MPNEKYILCDGYQVLVTINGRTGIDGTYRKHRWAENRAESLRSEGYEAEVKLADRKIRVKRVHHKED